MSTEPSTEEAALFVNLSGSEGSGSRPASRDFVRYMAAVMVESFGVALIYLTVMMETSEPWTTKDVMLGFATLYETIMPQLMFLLEVHRDRGNEMTVYTAPLSPGLSPSPPPSPLQSAPAQPSPLPSNPTRYKAGEAQVIVSVAAVRLVCVMLAARLRCTKRDDLTAVCLSLFIGYSPCTLILSLWLSAFTVYFAARTCCCLNGVHLGYIDSDT
jgi:hypothetical protein